MKNPSSLLPIQNSGTGTAGIGEQPRSKHKRFWVPPIRKDLTTYSCWHVQDETCCDINHRTLRESKRCPWHFPRARAWRVHIRHYRQSWHDRLLDAGLWRTSDGRIRGGELVD